MILLVILLILLALTVFLLAPSAKKGRAEAWRGTAFAHRGLHGGGAQENSIEAFEKACRAGYGIELDVQLSKDGAVVVFHDDDLKRMTGDGRRVDEAILADLKKLTLKGKGRIPTLGEALDCVDGRVPLLVEIKTGRRNAELCEKTMAQLRAYKGKYIVESFNPLILRWLKQHSPETIRGQLVGGRAAYIAGQGQLRAFLLSRLLLNCLARPDFVAYDVSVKRFHAPRLQRALFGTPLAAWTVRDDKLFRECVGRGEMPIFENFTPREG